MILIRIIMHETWNKKNNIKNYTYYLETKKLKFSNLK